MEYDVLNDANGNPVMMVSSDETIFIPLDDINLEMDEESMIETEDELERLRVLTDEVCIALDEAEHESE